MGILVCKIQKGMLSGNRGTKFHVSITSMHRRSVTAAAALKFRKVMINMHGRQGKMLIVSSHFFDLMPQDIASDAIMWHQEEAAKLQQSLAKCLEVCMKRCDNNSIVTT